MDDMAREWVNARLEATEERMNARLAGIETSIGLLVGKVDGLSIQLNDTKQILSKDVETAKLEATRSYDEAAKARDAALNTRWVVIGTGVALAALLGTMLAYGVQNFDSALAVVQTMMSVKGGSQ